MLEKWNFELRFSNLNYSQPQRYYVKSQVKKREKNPYAIKMNNFLMRGDQRQLVKK